MLIVVPEHETEGGADLVRNGAAIVLVGQQQSVQAPLARRIENALGIFVVMPTRGLDGLVDQNEPPRHDGYSALGEAADTSKSDSPRCFLS